MGLLVCFIGCGARPWGMGGGVGRVKREKYDMAWHGA